MTLNLPPVLNVIDPASKHIGRHLIPASTPQKLHHRNSQSFTFQIPESRIDTANGRYGYTPSSKHRKFSPPGQSVMIPGPVVEMLPYTGNIACIFSNQSWLKLMLHTTHNGCTNSC